jgi:hypothetical protein
MRSSNQRGIALITVLLVMMLMSALLVGFATVVISDQRYRFIDHDRGQAFYGASAGVEKLTTDLGNLFFTNLAPTTAQLTAMTAAARLPAITGVAFTAAVAPGILPTSPLSATNCVSPSVIRTVGTNGYTIKFCAGPGGNPTPVQPPKPIKSGPYEGLVALQTPYQIDVTARTPAMGEVHLVRSMESVAIPVFQFGIFSDVDQSFFAGPTFNFGGRVHTNGNLFLAQGDGTAVTFTDRVTAVKAIVRQELQNGVSIDTSPSHRGTVNVARAPGAVRALARTEGSVVAGPVSASNGAPPWKTTSEVSYNLWLRNGETGAKALNLALLTAGGTNPDLIRRPVTGENTSNPVLFNERLFRKASLRILLSDTAANITTLPGVTGSPVLLDKDWTIAANLPSNATGTYGPIDASHPPIAGTPGSMTARVLGGTTATDYHVDDVTPFLPVLKLAGIAIICDEKTATGFIHCTIPAAVAAANPLQLTGGSGTSPLTIAAVTAGNNQTITVSAGNLAAFRPVSFWSGDNLVTCGGWARSPMKFTGCSGAPAPSVGTILSNYALSAVPTSLIGGWLKIDRQDAAGDWTDVTIEILNHGIGGPNSASGGDPCGDPNLNAILRLQRFKDNSVAEGGCSYRLNATGTAYWPNVLFDAREALVRDTDISGSSNLPLGGVIHYITIDVANLSKWFAGTGPFAGGSGTTARTENNGFTVYFSDRRNNRNAAGKETGEYGWEDIVNPLSSTGAANDSLDAGEDLNGNGTLETYGKLPSFNGIAGSVPPGAAAPLDAAARPGTLLNPRQAQANRAILFRHALKLINGENIRGLGISGLTIASENPVYIQGNWNANGTFAGAHAATAVIADAVTLLTADWDDTVSFMWPYRVSPIGGVGGRPRGAASWYRLGIIAGKGRAFPRPSGTATDFGTDGGAHNFLRHLQQGNKAVNYRGSIATFYYNRQAVGTYKCCDTVYEAPDRFYNFDTDFLDPSLLPPNTPVFRDLNAVGFAQELRPGR